MAVTQGTAMHKHYWFASRIQDQSENDAENKKNMRPLVSTAQNDPLIKTMKCVAFWLLSFKDQLTES